MGDFKKFYESILECSQQIRQTAMMEWGDTLMFGGVMPPEVSLELATAAKITGLAFDALGRAGIPMTPVPGKNNLFSMEAGNKKYTCHKLAIPSLNGSQLDTDQTMVQEMTNSSQNNESIKSETVFEKTFAPEPIKEPEQKLELESEENQELETEIEESIEEDLETELEEAPEEEDLEEEPEDNKNMIPKIGAEIIGGTTNFGSLTREDLFNDEKQKFSGDMVYELFTLSMTHSGFAGGGKPDEFRVMVAPLKISRIAASAVPIIVSIFYKGTIVTRSSYDYAEIGKNLVTIDVNEFYLLIRGSYDANGNFKVYITTTGISANQGDIMNIISNKSFGKNAGANVGNGHIKFRCYIDDEPGVMEVFPFGEPKENDFIVMTKNPEFIDYTFISNSTKSLKKMFIYEQGVKKSVICQWNEDVLEVNIVEV